MPDDTSTVDLDRLPVSTRRLEAFTDGVFSIAATLLVLELTAGALGEVHSDAEFWRALFAIVPAVLNFAISFLLLGLLWMVHVRQFEHVVAVDTPMLWLNVLRLLGVVFVPFATVLNDEYSGFLGGRMMLPATFLWVILFGTWQWIYATNPRRGLVRDLPVAALHNSRVAAWSALVTAVLVVALSAIIGSFAFLLFALDPVVRMVLRRMGVLRLP
jgi:uncharacterized membrane protein